MCGCAFPNKEGSGERRGESRGEPGRGRGGGEGSEEVKRARFGGEMENESKWSTASSARAGADEPGSGVPACGGWDSPLGAPGKACFRFNPNLTVWIEPEGI